MVKCGCQNIQRLIVINSDTKANHGIAKLIEVQKNLKYFEWRDKYYYFRGNPYRDIFLALAEKTDTLDHFLVHFLIFDEYENYEDRYDFSFLQNLLPKLSKIKTLEIFPPKLNNYNLKKQLMSMYFSDLEVIKMNGIGFDPLLFMIKNSGGNLREIITNYESFDYEEFGNYDDYDKAFLTFIRTIHKECPLIEYLSLGLLTDEDFDEFEKLLKNCQKLKILILGIINELGGCGVNIMRIFIKNGERILNILALSAPISLREIRLHRYIMLLIKALGEFLEKWKGRPALTIIGDVDRYYSGGYEELVNKYKKEGVIKDFRIVSYNKILDQIFN